MDSIHQLISASIFGDNGGSNETNSSAPIEHENASNEIPDSIQPNTSLVRDSLVILDDSSPENNTFEDADEKKNQTSIESTYELLEYNSSGEEIESHWSTVSRPVDLLNGEGAPKKIENNSVEERDTYSPLSPSVTNSNDSIFAPNIKCPLAEPSPEDTDINKSARRTYFGCEYTRLSSKEEKQRQNEEIVIMESSSVSSETGSWESVFPQYTPLDLKEYCKLFLINERKNVQSVNEIISPKLATTVEQSKVETDPAISTAIGACFIDASSLLDDTEILFPAEIIGPKLPDVACRGPCSSNKIFADETISNIGWNSDESGLQSDTINGDLKKSESFNLERINSKKSSNSKKTSPAMNSPNLSDEQKLLHRDTELNAESDIKDQFSTDAKTDQKIFATYAELGSNDMIRSLSKDVDKESKHRQEQERKQGHFLFKHSIQHFSGHVVNPKNCFGDKNCPSNNSLTNLSSNITSDNSNDGNNDNDVSLHQYESFMDSSSLNSYSQPFYETESVGYPDTPHNSIINIDSSRCSSCVDDAPVSSEIGIKIPKKNIKCDDSTPILSGGVSVEDFMSKQCSSPLVIRRSEACPILCTGAISTEYLEEIKPKKAEKPNNLALNSWVVDMSDCSIKSKRQRSESSSSSTDNTAPSNRSDRSGSEEHKTSLGFYGSLDNIKTQKATDITSENPTKSMTDSLHENKKMSTGFYVNFTDDEQKKSVKATDNIEKPKEKDKKSIFSMFFDLGDKAQSSKAVSNFPSHLSSATKECALSQSDNSNISAAETNKKFFGKTEVLRRSLPSNVNTSNANKRHSWNTSKDKIDKKDSSHSRSASLSTDKNVIMNILDKVPHLSKTSSMSIDSPNSPYDDFTYSKSLGSYSNDSNSLTSISIHSSVEAKVNPEIQTIMTTSARRRQRDAKINETFDKSSQGSLTDGILSKDSSPTTDTDDITFQNDAENAIINTVMETIVESIETASPKKQNPSKVQNKMETHTMESLQATIEKQKQLLETVSEEVQLSSFVKLSDMDKPAQKFELHPEDNLSKSTGSSRIGRLFIDTRSNASKNVMNHMSKSTGTNLTNLASSVENLRSLTRLFPHLSKELSSSLPADIQTEDIIKKSPSSECGPLDIMSCTSSLTSSYSRSGIDSADESSLSCRQPRRLGEDLLKMFLQEIATDVIIEVGGRRMRAHKCILRSRCQYFAAILAGGWVQSAGNVISIPGYSYGSVHFALCHIYSGASHPPDGISLMELAALADLLGLEGLKEVTAHALRTSYCHNFHKPCSGCIDGILQVFPITLNHGLDDLYRKCLRWTCKYFAKVWPTRAFSQLPGDIISRCKQHIVAHLTSETVLTTIVDFDQLISLLAPCRWAVGVENTVRDIIDIAHSYISDHFANLLASDGFLSLGHGQSWNISRLENILLRIASTLTPEQACKSYQRVTRLNVVLAAKVIKLPSPSIHIQEFGDDDEEMDWNGEFIRLVDSILSAVEQCLTRQCARAMRNSQWLRMDVELRNKIQKLACLSEPVEMRHAKSTKSLNYNMCLNNHNRNQSLHQIKLAIRAHSKQPVINNQYKATAHTQTNSDYNVENIDCCIEESQESKLNYVLKSSDAVVPDVIPSVRFRTISRPTYSHSRSQSETSKIAKPTPTINSKATVEKPKTPKLSDVKSRYLESFKHRNTNQNKSQTKAVVKTKNISSSESSTRNSSPASSKRSVCRLKPKNDSNNMSRDSLSSPAKQSKTFKNNKNPDDFDAYADSLGNSLKTSIQTDKTSQESLVKCNLKPSKDLVAKSGSRLNIVGSKDTSTKNFLKRNKSSSCQTTTESSPASVTTKSSRLSSIASTVSSPRDVLRTRTTTTNTSQVNASNVRKSFLSAKSKEILAKKQALNQSESTKSVPSIIKDNLTIPVNKSSSTSNMLKRKPNPFSTTLHLRRTATLNTGPLASNVGAKKNLAAESVDNKNGKNKNFKKIPNKTAEVAENYEDVSLRIEAKLERSSTFCKESSDIPISALQVIE